VAGRRMYPNAPERSRIGWSCLAGLSVLETSRFACGCPRARSGTFGGRPPAAGHQQFYVAAPFGRTNLELCRRYEPRHGAVTLRPVSQRFSCDRLFTDRASRHSPALSVSVSPVEAENKTTIGTGKRVGRPRSKLVRSIAEAILRGADCLDLDL